MRTVTWVIVLATLGLVFDGYDLVVYGAVVSTFLRDATQIGTVTPAIAGMLGSYALVGVMVGALTAGTVGDILGRRKVILTSYAWFSIGMALSAMAHQHDDLWLAALLHRHGRGLAGGDDRRAGG